MKKGFFFILLILTIAITAWGQTHVVWDLYKNEGLSFINGKIATTVINNAAYNASTICTYSGKLDLYNSDNILYDASNNPVIGWVGISIDSFHNTSVIIDINI